MRIQMFWRYSLKSKLIRWALNLHIQYEGKFRYCDQIQVILVDNNDKFEC